MVNRLLTWLWKVFVHAYNPSIMPAITAQIPMPQGAAIPVQAGLLSTKNLFVLNVDFAVSPNKRTEIEENLDRLREQYSIDFMLLEPGIRLSRFDDI